MYVPCILLAAVCSLNSRKGGGLHGSSLWHQLHQPPTVYLWVGPGWASHSGRLSVLSYETLATAQPSALQAQSEIGRPPCALP